MIDLDALLVPPDWVVQYTRDTSNSWYLIGYLRARREVTPAMRELLADILDGTLTVTRRQPKARVIYNDKLIDARQAFWKRLHADIKGYLKGVGPPELVKQYRDLATEYKQPWERKPSEVAKELMSILYGGKTTSEMIDDWMHDSRTGKHR